MSAAKIIVIGSSNSDMVIQSEKLPKPGETVMGKKFFMNPGGKGANQAVAASRLGGAVLFIARVGNDLFGKQAVFTFKKEGIDTSLIVADPQNPSGVALISVDDKGENSIVVAPGANSALNVDDIQRAAAVIQAAEIVITQLEIPMDTVEFIGKSALAAGKKFILNPAPATKLSDELLKTVFVITPNETEAAILSGITVSDVASAKKAAEKIRARGVKNVIITMGSNGAFILSDEFTGTVSAPKVKAIDTTAAGDVFNGALSVALSEKLSIKEAVEFAVRAASISVTRMGAQSSIPYKKEIAETTFTA
ncbi:MAG: ribokinase [Bacteroidetes bacterium]|nr:ribokinase [Bacteroidota bacterium]